MDENYEKRGYLLEDFRLFHLKDDRGTKVDYHYHEFCKIVLLLSGSGSYTVEGRRYLLLPGDIVLVGSRCVHKPEFEEGISYERMILYISPSLLAENSVPDYSLEDVFSGKPGHVLRPAEDVRRRLRSLAEQLESEMAASGGENAILSRCTLLRLLVEIGRAMQKTGSELPQPVVPRDGKILDILRYLETNLAEDISIDDLAAQFFISKYHMMRRFREETGTVDAPIARHRTARKRMAVAADGRRAVTHWKVLERYPGYTHIQCNLETGRTHQIRVHMAYIGHPVLGDPVYGGKRKETFGLTGQCLHARKLAFQHPRTGERMEVECPLPDYFQEVLRKLSMRK